jgi:DNA-binding NtrC family response regulator
VEDGPDRGAAFSASAPRLIVGTHASCQFVLSDRSLSRFHCELAVHDGRVVVQDLDSKNGTRVNGVEVRAAYLEDGDILTMGRSRVRYRVGTERVRVSLPARDRFGQLVGRSAAMRAVYHMLERAAESDLNVLLLGETGVGKESAARSIHELGSRRTGPFIIVDAGAIPSSLLDSELFGHERGAFTGADQPRAGAFERASGGTLLLDEIAGLSLELQPKVLRALEHREVQRVGGERRIPVEARVITTSNRELLREVNAGRFRADLYYRLAVLEITMPPLRGRAEDLPLLIEHFLEQLGLTTSPAASAVRAPTFLAEVARHPWPGNVRELRNYVERYVVTGARPIPTSRSLALPEQGLVDPRQPLKTARRYWLDELERRYLSELLRIHGDNVSAAARAAGLARTHFHRLLARHGLRQRS